MALKRLLTLGGSSPAGLVAVAPDAIVVTLFCPLKILGSSAPTLIARVGAARSRSVAGSRPSSRFNQPSGVALLPGVPDSMLSCPSKWERVGSGDPAAWTRAQLPCLRA